MIRKKLFSVLLCCLLVLSICPVANAAGTVTGAEAVAAAQTLVGKYPYVYGGKSPSDGGFDCTGLIYYVYHNLLGCNVTHNQIWSRSVPGTKITDKSGLLPGDIVFGLTGPNSWHTGLYCGNNTMIHSGSNGASRTSINGTWFAFQFATRPSFTKTTPSSTNTTASSLPTNLTVSTDKSSYTLGESVVITPSANNATHYAISVWLGAFNTGERLYVNYNLPGGITFNPTKPGTYTIRADAKNSNGYIYTEKTFTVIETSVLTVAFDSNGGSVSPAQITISAGSPYGELPTPSNGNLKFDGWYSERSGGTKVGSTSFPIANTNHTLYAHWIDLYHATLDPNGGTVQGSTSPIRVEYHSSNNFPTATRPGYIFDGWYAKEDGKKAGNGWTNYGGEAYFYAQWTPIEEGKCVVTFDSLGGSLVDSLEVEKGGTYGKLPICFGPTVEYIMLGWFTSPTGGTRVKEGDPLVVNEDHTLYAHYEKVFYTITLNPNGGTVPMELSGYMASDPQDILVGAKTSVYRDLPNAVRSGYEFLGWYTAPDGGTQVVKGMSYIVQGNHTLYAHWR